MLSSYASSSSRERRRGRFRRQAEVSLKTTTIKLVVLVLLVSSSSLLTAMWRTVEKVVIAERIGNEVVVVVVPNHVYILNICVRG